MGIWLQEGCAVAGAILVDLTARGELSLLNGTANSSNVDQDEVEKEYIEIRAATCNFPLPSWGEDTEQQLRTPRELFKAQNDNLVGSSWFFLAANPKLTGLRQWAEFEASLSLRGIHDENDLVTRGYQFTIELRNLEGPKGKRRYMITKAKPISCKRPKIGHAVWA